MYVSAYGGCMCGTQIATYRVYTLAEQDNAHNSYALHVHKPDAITFIHGY